MKNTLTFIAFALIVLLMLLFLSSVRKVPFIPPDVLHKAVTKNAACMECHAPGKQAPLKQNHPPKEQCLTCHKLKEA